MHQSYDMITYIYLQNPLILL